MNSPTTTEPRAVGVEDGVQRAPAAAEAWDDFFS
jgi:hypothetical protein